MSKIVKVVHFSITSVTDSLIASKLAIPSTSYNSKPKNSPLTTYFAVR